MKDKKPQSNLKRLGLKSLFKRGEEVGLAGDLPDDIKKQLSSMAMEKRRTFLLGFINGEKKRK